MMRPPRGLWSFMILKASCVHTNNAVRFVSTTSFHFSTGNSWNGTGGAPMPALLNSTSSRPYLSFTVANSARMASTLVTSVGTAMPLPPPSFRTASSGSLRRPARPTEYPAFISASAAARPTPVPAPVTIATLAMPFSRFWFRENCAEFGKSPQCPWSRSEQPRLIAEEHAFEREHLFLGRGAAGRRKAAELAARGEHAVARDDQRYGIARHRDAHVLRGLRLPCAHALGELAVGDGLAEADLAQRLINRAAERIGAGKVEPDALEADALAREIAPCLLDHSGDVRRRLGRRRAGEPVRCRFLRARKVEARHTGVVPRDGGKAEFGVEHVIVGHRKSRCGLIMRYAARGIPPPVSSSFRRRPKLRRARGTSPARSRKSPSARFAQQCSYRAARCRSPARGRSSRGRSGRPARSTGCARHREPDRRRASSCHNGCSARLRRRRAEQ